MAFDFVPPPEFFRLLYTNTAFCKALGQIALGAGMLEASIQQQLKCRGHKVAPTTPLGGLVRQLKDKGLLSPNGEFHLTDLVSKRNYLAHNLYALFCGELDATLLPKNGLVAEDVSDFIEKAENLADDFVFFGKKIASHPATSEIIF